MLLTMKATLSIACTITPALERGYHYYVAARKSSQLWIEGSANALHVLLFFPLCLYIYIRNFIGVIPVMDPIETWSRVVQLVSISRFSLSEEIFKELSPKGSMVSINSALYNKRKRLVEVPW